MGGIDVDQWEHSERYYERLLTQNWDPEEMFQYSLFLGILQNSEILYDRENLISEYQEKAHRWKWSQKCIVYIEEKYNQVAKYQVDKSKILEKSIYQKKRLLLETCNKLVELGKPVSIRNKDLYRNHLKISSADNFRPIFGEPDVEYIRELVEQGFSLFHSENQNRNPYTELMDAKKHLINGESFLSYISLQNGAYYLGIKGLTNREVKLETIDFLNPESEMELKEKTKEAWPEFHQFYKRIHSL